MAWQDILTAPTDDTVVDLWWSQPPDEQYRITDCKYRNDTSWIDDGGSIITADHVTHWMLPPPPPEGG